MNDICKTETRKATSWLFHSEELETVADEFPYANLRAAIAMNKWLAAEQADYDEVHKWAQGDDCTIRTIVWDLELENRENKG